MEDLGTQTGLILLARREEGTASLTTEDWFTLAESRYRLIKEQLRDMTLEPIEKIPGLSMSNAHLGPQHCSIKDTDPQPKVEAPDGLSLNTRGIFPVHHTDVMHDSKGGGCCFHEETQRDITGNWIDATTIRAWGLTRNGDWITIETQISYTREAKRQDGYDITAESVLVEKVILNYSTLREACVFANRHPEYVCKRIQDVSKQWLEQRQRLLTRAQDLASVLTQEELLMKTLFPDRRERLRLED